MLDYVMHSILKNNLPYTIYYGAWEYFLLNLTEFYQAATSSLDSSLTTESPLGNSLR